MNISIVTGQMCVVLILVLTGCILYKKKKINDMTSRQISGLVVNICNPAVLISSAFDSAPKAASGQLLTALAVTLFIYGLLLCAGAAIPRLMRIPSAQRYVYHFLTVYGNVGFLGIPLVSAVLGSRALIYVSINCLVFNILFYTTGTGIIRKAAGRENGEVPVSDGVLGKLFNAGTVSAVITILFYLSDIHVPAVVTDTVTFAGRATTFLSMLVLGVSVAQIPLKSIFSHKKDYVFVFLRMVLLPVCFVLVLRRFITEPLILGTSALLIAVPAANLPLMCSREYGLESEALARIIILTTLFSILTIPFVALFV